MSTVATPELKELARQWQLLFKSAKISGIVGDTSHAKRGGYHISREDQVSPTNYSVVRPDDKGGPADAASAVDMTLNRDDMILCTSRLIKLFDNVNDPRRKYINAFNGTTDGVTAKRWDVYARRVGTASKDHCWHVHVSIRRRYANSPTAVKAIVSGLKGESVATYLASIGVKPVAKPVATTPVKKPVAPPTLKAPTWSGRDLKRNDGQKSPDPAVKLFQARMLQRGWTSLGKADGFFGPKLESVVKRWQKECKLQADGIIGKNTWPTPWTRPLGS